MTTNSESIKISGPNGAGKLGEGGVTPKEDKHNYRDRQAVRKQSNQLKQLFISNVSLFFLYLYIRKGHFAFTHVCMLHWAIDDKTATFTFTPGFHSNTNELTQPYGQTPQINTQISIVLWLQIWSYLQCDFTLLHTAQLCVPPASLHSSACLCAQNLWIFGVDEQMMYQSVTLTHQSATPMFPPMSSSLSLTQYTLTYTHPRTRVSEPKPDVLCMNLVSLCGPYLHYFLYFYSHITVFSKPELRAG